MKVYIVNEIDIEGFTKFIGVYSTMAKANAMIGELLNVSDFDDKYEVVTARMND